MTDAPPTPRPPINRKNTSDHIFQAIAEPSAEKKYNRARTFRLSRLPIRSAGFVNRIDPKMVPINAEVTVNPSDQLFNPKISRILAVVPEITAVSNPKRSPPRAETTADRKSTSVTPLVFLIYCFVF
jgi:hypothetical protein